jgi:hypothetical protein
MNYSRHKYFHSLLFLTGCYFMTSLQHFLLKHSQTIPRTERQDPVFVTRGTGKMIVVHVLILDFSDRKGKENITVLLFGVVFRKRHVGRHSL